MTLVNLTPHPVRVYGWAVPARFAYGAHEPIVQLPASGEPARLGELSVGAGTTVDGVPVEHVEFGRPHGLPGETTGTWLIVSLPLALAVGDRADLLVPYREVRNLEGTVIGCRALAQPI